MLNIILICILVLLIITYVYYKLSPQDQETSESSAPAFGQPDERNWSFFWKNQLIWSVVAVAVFLIFAWWNGLL